MMSLHASTATVRSATPPTPLTSSHNRKRSVRRTLSRTASLNTKKIASDEKVQSCYTPLVCDGEGPVECKTVYESQCETRYHEHDVEDDVVNCKTVYESQCETRYHEHDVEDDVVSCTTVYDEKCEDVTQGYTTEKKCTKWPKQVCK